MMNALFRRIALLLLFTAALAENAVAQEAPPKPSNEEETVQSEETAATSTSQGRDDDALSDLQKRLADQEAAIARQGDDMKAMEERHAKEIEELTARLDAAEEAELEEMGEGGKELDPTLNMYGFFDLALFKYFLEEDNPVYGIQPHSLSFTMTNINLYFASQMTQTLSALVELRLSFAPQGVENDLLEYNRVDNTFIEPVSIEELHPGSVIIERAHVTWQPYDFFGVTAGRFLTPFGIWNVDHGSPVFLPVQLPYMMNREFIPLAQTGVQIHGRLFPTEQLFFDYALTASNGRGPTETLYDLEEDKALGLKLKLSYRGKNTSVALGGYGYWGHTTDVVKSIDFSDPNKLFEIAIDKTYDYRELDGAVDFLLETYGVRVQAEYIRGIVRYDVRPPVVFPVVNIENQAGKLQPDYIKWDGYVLLAWQLPLEALIGEMRLTPYAVLERSVLDDTLNDFDIVTFRGGLNFKPNSFITLKLEGAKVSFPKSDFVTDTWWILGGQAAVSF